MSDKNVMLAHGITIDAGKTPNCRESKTYLTEHNDDRLV